MIENPIMQAFQHAPAGMAILRPDGTVLQANNAFACLTGISHEEWIRGVRFAETLHPGDRGAFRQSLQCSAQGSCAVPVAVRFLGADERVLTAELSVHVMQDADGNTIHTLLYANTDELRQTIRNQQGFMFKFTKIGADFVHTLCDGELLYRMGLTPDQVIGKTLKEFMGSASHAVLKEKQYQRAWEGEDVVYEGCRGGIWYFASLRPIVRDGAVREVIASCVDITERKQTERQLMEAKEQFESLFICSPTAIDLLDRDGNVIRVNPAHEALYGWKNEELAGRPLPIYPDHRPDDYAMLMTRMLEGGAVVDYMTERVRKDGTVLKVCLTVAPLRDKEGRIFAFTGFTRDITDSLKTQELLQKADKLNVVGHLAAGLAHEIRNPLTSLRGFLQLLRSGHQEKDKYYELMLSELDRINTILSELLIIAKPQVTSFQRKSLSRMLIEVLLLLEPQAILQNIDYRTDFEIGEMPVHCSETQLKQVFLNIIKNGMEAMPNGGKLTVHLSQTWHQEIVVRISDQGVGIPEDRLHRLGEPFYTSKERGTGLGLMMCYKIVEAHKGTIKIRSKEHEGTTVEVTLPCCP